MKINSYRVRPVGGEKELEFVVDARVVETIERQETPWEHGVTVDTAMPGSLAVAENSISRRVASGGAP